jgi:hypothetical protein
MYPVLSGRRMKRPVWFGWTSPDVGGVGSGEYERIKAERALDRNESES